MKGMGHTNFRSRSAGEAGIQTRHLFGKSENHYQLSYMWPCVPLCNGNITIPGCTVPYCSVVYSTVVYSTVICHIPCEF